MKQAIINGENFIELELYSGRKCYINIEEITMVVNFDSNKTKIYFKGDFSPAILKIPYSEFVNKYIKAKETEEE